MWRAAVLGSPVAHSLSPVLHQAGYAAYGLTQWRYEAREVEQAALGSVVASLGQQWRGLSLTMPLKEAAFAVAASATARAHAAGAINTLVREGAQWSGDNTDIEGIIAAIRHVDHHGRASILGSGATSRSAVLALHALGVEQLTIAARNRETASEAATLATSLGMTAQWILLQEWAVRADPLVVSTLPPSAGVAAAQALSLESGAAEGMTLLDVVYADWPTPLAQRVSEAGGEAVSGLEMLVHQAAAQFTLFTGCEAPVAQMLTAGRAALAQPPSLHPSPGITQSSP